MALRATLGTAPRSGSAVLVAICGSEESPRLLDRRRFAFVPDDLPEQAYHAAAELELAAAGALIDRWQQAAVEAASQAINEVVADAIAGYELRGMGIVGVVREVPPLGAVLRSHPLLHVAEGQLSREVMSEAAGRAGLPVHYLAPKGRHDPRHAELAAEMRRDAGVPWRKEHKLATIAALAVLGAQ